MAINVNMTGSGDIGEIEPGWSVNEFATPVTIGDSAGGTGTVNVSAGKKPTSKLIVNNGITTTDEVLGSVSGTVKTVNTSGPNVSLTHSAPLAKFDADANIPALSTGGVYPAVDICSQLIGENQLKSGLSGWYGSLAGHSALFDASSGRVYGSAYYVNYRYYNNATGKYETIRIASATNSVGAGSHAYAANGELYASNVDGDSFSPDPTVANVNYVAYRAYVPSGGTHSWAFSGNPIYSGSDWGFVGTVLLDRATQILSVSFDYSIGGSATTNIQQVSVSGIDWSKEIYVFIKYAFQKTTIPGDYSNFYLSASVANVDNVTTYYSASAFMQLYTLPSWYTKWAIVGYARNLWRNSEVSQGSATRILRTNLQPDSSFQNPSIKPLGSLVYDYSGSGVSDIESIDTTVSYSGSNSYKVEIVDSFNNIEVHADSNVVFTVPIGTKLKVSAYIKSSVEETNWQNNIGIEYEGLSYWDAPQANSGLSTSWTRITANAVTTNSASLTGVKFFYSGTYTGAGDIISRDIWIDAIQIEVVESTTSPATEYFDGDTPATIPNTAHKFSAPNAYGLMYSNEYSLSSIGSAEIPSAYDNPLSVVDNTTAPTYTGEAIGFKGNMWEYLQSACSAYGKEIAVVNDFITLRDAGSTVLDITNVVASPTVTPSATLTGKAVEVVQQNTTPITDAVVYDAYDDDNKILSVKVNEVVTTTIDAKTYLTSVFQPERRFALPNADGCYIVCDNTGLPIPTSKAISLITTAAAGSGTVATLTTKGAHGVKPGDSVTVTGITPSGYNGTYTVTTVPTSTTFTYSNATTGAQTKAGKVAYTSATTMWEDYGGKLEVSISEDIPGGIVVKLTGPSREIPGYTGPYKIAANDDDNDFAALSIIGRGIKSKPETVSIRTGAAESKTTQDVAKTINNPFIADTQMAYDRGIWASVDASGPRVTLSGTISAGDIDGFGLAAGSLITYDDSQYRVTDVTIGNLGVSFNATRFVDVADFNALWSTKTVAYHDGVWDGFDTQDQIIMPFYGQSIINGYIGFDTDGSPYLKITGTGNGEAKLLFDTDGDPYYSILGPTDSATLLNLDVDFTPYYV